MNMRRFVLASALLLAATAFAAAEEQPQNDAAAEPQWTEFSAPERGFAASFPGTPTVTSTPVEGQNPLVQHQFQVTLGDDRVYTVVVFEYPVGRAPSPPDNEYFSNVVTAYAKGSEARLRKKGPVTIAGRPGYEASADDGKRKISHLLDLVPAGDRIYLLVSAGPKAHATSEEAQSFRDSFRLLGDSAKPAEELKEPAQSDSE